MKRDTALILGAGAFFVGGGLDFVKYLKDSGTTTPGWAAVGWAQQHPVAATVVAYTGYKALYPMVRKAL